MTDRASGIIFFKQISSFFSHRSSLNNKIKETKYRSEDTAVTLRSVSKHTLVEFRNDGIRAISDESEIISSYIDLT